MYLTFIYAFLTVLVLLGLYTFRNGISRLIYRALKGWKEITFITACLTAGAFIGMSQSSRLTVTLDLNYYIASLQSPENELTRARIRQCKNFITAKMDPGTRYPDPRPPLRDAILIGARSYWDSCAHLFGTNYWKYDITIDGENGGELLCKAYEAQSYRSQQVNTWCKTVFAPKVKI